ncbi:SipW-cognate class signal peptide [Halogranum gelatinilyticum]|uniref:SipW-cognate class signal peptide n=1 Tax=Halogranum gelatinilyticum TaxID=660521 RepID=A0A1G9VW87_9EURY|nr:SipW-dependent-type signal peptide-containing protein [Halogranum gelatinilyticum]SDM76592.1 SipW-cognate class signal peptide [Halogranum gelatinilyticum]
MRVTRQRLAALYAVVGLVMASLGGGVYTHAAFSDSETSEVTIQAASDFTVTAGNFDADPGHISRSSNGGTFHVHFDIDEPGQVDTDRFTLRIVETGGTLDATRASCKEKRGGVNCRIKFERDELVTQTDSAGTYDLVLSGWWDRGRDFELTGTVEITQSEERCTNTAGNTDCDSTTEQSTDNDDRCTSVTGNSGCESTPTQSAGNQQTCTSSSTNSGCESTTTQILGGSTTLSMAASTRG